MERIKEIMLLLLTNDNLDGDPLLYILSELADLSEISGKDDFTEEFNQFSCTTVFVEESLKFFIAAKKDSRKYDDWINYYKQQLLNIENYELINYLSL